MAIAGRHPAVEGRLWPNGEYSFGLVRKMRENPFDLMDARFEEQRGGHVFVEDELDMLEGMWILNRSVHLGLSNVANSHRGEGQLEVPGRKARGSKGLTRYGAKMLRNGCCLIERSSPKHTVSFGTLTVPEFDHQTLLHFMEELPQILRVFFQRLSRALVRENLPGEVCYVIELHPKREDSAGIPWPHVHCVFQGKRRQFDKQWAITPKEFGKIWKEVVCHRLPETGKTWRKSHWNLTCVMKSVEGYMAKYLSKGASRAQAKHDETASEFRISSWWGAVGGIKKRIARGRTILRTDDCLGLIDTWHDESTRHEILYYNDIYMSVEGRRLWLGGAGKLRPEARAGWEDHIRSRNALDNIGAWT